MSDAQNRTKNDSAWEHLFNKHQILDHINQDGSFTITSAQINAVRESRLMAKFDHVVNLPHIFREHALSILPTSRSEYLIGHLNTHQKVAYNTEVETLPEQLPPGIESIDYTNLYSEAAALSCAYNAGIIDDLIGEKTLHTVSGRMSTERFDFSIEHSLNNAAPYHIAVDHSQCEIDAGFESDHHFFLVEAKNYAVDDFLIRQLYYPYRLWSGKLSKKVIPTLMTFSNDVFDFFLYAFDNDLEYNSLRLVEQKRYTLAPEEILRDDVDSIFSAIKLAKEPTAIAFPQADRFDRVVDLLSLLAARDLSKDDITESYAFDVRQTQYYTDAARYLGLVEKYKDRAAQEEVTFRLTPEAHALLKQRRKLKYLGLIRKILEHEVFYKVFHVALQQGAIPSTEEISQIISSSNIQITGATIGRRASTVRAWVGWIWKQIDE